MYRYQIPTMPEIHMKFHIYILRIDGTRDEQTSSFFRDSFGSKTS